jgi:hypothetical protein
MPAYDRFKVPFFVGQSLNVALLKGLYEDRALEQRVVWINKINASYCRSVSPIISNIIMGDALKGPSNDEEPILRNVIPVQLDILVLDPFSPGGRAVKDTS